MAPRIANFGLAGVVDELVELGDGAVEVVVDDGDGPEAAAEVTLGERLVEPLADLLVGVTPLAEPALLLLR